MAAPRGIDWEQVPLGRYDDAELARRLLTSRQAVCFQRNMRKIPPVDRAVRAFTQELAPMERKDLADLERALDDLTNDAAIALTFAVASCVSLVPGWRVESRHAKSQKGSGGRSTAFRFCHTRLWSIWMQPRAARTWLMRNGWADAATARIAELRARTAMEGARAT